MNNSDISYCCTNQLFANKLRRVDLIRNDEISFETCSTQLYFCKIHFYVLINHIYQIYTEQRVIFFYYKCYSSNHGYVKLTETRKWIRKKRRNVLTWFRIFNFLTSISSFVLVMKSKNSSMTIRYTKAYTCLCLSKILEMCNYEAGCF